MRQTSIAFKSNGVTLEGVIASAPGIIGASPGVVVCHPHPLFGGDMDNRVVTALCKALAEESIVTLRFNFRGVRKSEGQFTKGEEEREDTHAALELMRNWPGVKRGRVGMAGYSFGASMILSDLSRYKGVKSIVLISPPLASLENKAIVRDKRPKRFIVGDRDRLVPCPSLEEKVRALATSAELRVVHGADHSWQGHEADAARSAVEFFMGTLVG